MSNFSKIVIKSIYIILIFFSFLLSAIFFYGSTPNGNSGEEFEIIFFILGLLTLIIGFGILIFGFFRNFFNKILNNNNSKDLNDTNINKNLNKKAVFLSIFIVIFIFIIIGINSDDSEPIVEKKPTEIVKENKKIIDLESNSDNEKIIEKAKANQLIEKYFNELQQYEEKTLGKILWVYESQLINLEIEKNYTEEIEAYNNLWSQDWYFCDEITSFRAMSLYFDENLDINNIDDPYYGDDEIYEKDKLNLKNKIRGLINNNYEVAQRVVRVWEGIDNGSRLDESGGCKLFE